MTNHMNTIKSLSKLLLVIFFFIVLLTEVNAQKENLKPKAIVEATIKYIPGGGTREINYQSGYLLTFPCWIVEPKEAGPKVFVESTTDLKKFIGKRVHVEGMYEKVPSKKISPVHFSEGYERIIADTVYSIE